MTAEERKTLIAQYNDGYRVVAEAVAGATDEQLDARPAPGKWSAREVVHHLADSEMTAATRLRLLVAIENPQIFGYDQEEFARKLYYDRPIAASLDAFKAARRATAEILERMSDADWARAAARTPSTVRTPPSAGSSSTPHTRTRTPSRSWSRATRRRNREFGNWVIW